MQEEYGHLTKRHDVLTLFHEKEEYHYDEDSQWHNPNHPIYDLPDCENSCVVVARFNNNHMETVYFCNRDPHWWYVDLNGRKPVIQDKIIEWKYLSNVTD